MSYILEALRKAELERELSRVPGISSSHHFAHSTGRIPARLWLLAAAALALGGAASWLWLGAAPALVQAAVITNEAPSREPATPAAMAEPPPEEQAPAVPLSAEPLPDGMLAGVSTGVEEAVPEQEPAPIIPQAATEPQSSEPVEIRTESDSTIAFPEAAPEKLTQPVDPVVAMIAAEAERGWPAGNSQLPAVPEGADPRPDSPLSGTDGTATEEALPPLLKTLPYRFQNTLPATAINAQAYAEEAEARFVIINMKKYREGQSTPEGVMVESIGKDYLILSYQGQVFRMQR